MADRVGRGCRGGAEGATRAAQDASFLESRSLGARPVMVCRLPAIRRTFGILTSRCALGVWAPCQRRSSRRTHPGSRASASQMFSNENGQVTSDDSNQSAVSRRRRWRRTPREPEHRQNVRIASSSTAAMSRSSGVRSADRCRSSANCTGSICSGTSSLGPSDSSWRSSMVACRSNSNATATNTVRSSRCTARWRFAVAHDDRSSPLPKRRHALAAPGAQPLYPADVSATPARLRVMHAPRSIAL